MPVRPNRRLPQRQTYRTEEPSYEDLANTLSRAEMVITSLTEDKTALSEEVTQLNKRLGRREDKIRDLRGRLEQLQRVVADSVSSLSSAIST